MEYNLIQCNILFDSYCLQYRAKHGTRQRVLDLKLGVFSSGFANPATSSVRYSSCIAASLVSASHVAGMVQTSQEKLEGCC